MIKVGSNAQKNPIFMNVTKDQLYNFHLASLEVLESVGVIVEKEDMLKLFKDAGCIIDKNLVRFPASIVDRAIGSAPLRVVLSNSEGIRSVFLEQNIVHFGAHIGQQNVIDPESMLIRETTNADIENLTRIAETLEFIDFISLPACDDMTDSLNNYKSVRSLSTKPILIDTKDPKITQILIEIANAFSHEHEKQNFTHTAFHVESISPLVLTVNDIDNIEICCKSNTPIAFTSQLILGVTAPDHLESAIVLGVANALAALVLSQLLRSGSQFVIGITLLQKEISSPDVFCTSPENNKAQSIIGQLARFYNLPSFSITASTDAFIVDQQAALEATYTILASTIAGVNFNSCFGNKDVMSYESLILANEIIGMTNHFMKGVEISEETIPLDLIHDVGPGGEFVTTVHTLKHFRTANYYPRYINRQHFSLWLKDDNKSMREKLTLRALDILSEPLDKKLSENILSELHAISEKYNQQLQDKGGL